MSQPHPATETVWTWLEKGDGRKRSEDDRARIREILMEIDRELHALDRLTSDA